MEQPGWVETAEGFRRYLLTHGKTPDTAKTYVQHLRTFWNYRLCCSGEVTSIGRDAVEDYLFDQLARVASSTAHVRLSALKAYLRWRLNLPAERSGIGREIHPHMLRYYFAVHFCELGGGIDHLQSILGHSSIEMSMHYSKAGRENRARQAQVKFNPADALTS